MSARNSLTGAGNGKRLMIPHIDRATFFFFYRSTFHITRLKQLQVDGLNTLLSSIESDTYLSDLRHAAYMLATVKHECADTWQPIVERGPRSYFSKYEPGTLIGKRLGNVWPGDGYRYRGRGYVQITGQANYLRLSDVVMLGDTLADDPDRALDPDIAYQIMSRGMRKGLFTGKKLSDYINERECDYINSRRIINGLDRASVIALHAERFETVLRAATGADL